MGEPLLDPPGPIVPIASALWFLGVAVVGGLVVRLERLSGADQGARQRTALARVVTGGIAVLGVAWALLGPAHGWDSQIEPIIGEVATMAVAGVLVWLAARSGSSSWLYPAGLGVLVALTHLNAFYLDEAIGTGPALFVEGLILIVVGVGVELARRRLAARRRAAALPSLPTAPSTPAFPG
jgi:hypothetical protein